MSLATGLKTYCVDSGIYLRHPEKLFEVFVNGTHAHIDRLASEAASLSKPVFVQIADDDNRGAKQLCRRRGG
jgi:hypothetical protein